MSYIHEIQKSLDYIEENIDQKLSLKQMAQYALCSEYHFHRIFHSAVGLPLNEYIRKRRVSKAAGMLRDDDNKIAEISQRCGFDSQTAFTRAFKSIFGLTPGQFRNNNLPATFYERVDLSGRKFLPSYRGVTFGPTITYLPEMKLAGTEVTGTYREFAEDDLTHRLWDAFLPRVSEIKNAVGPRIYGALYANPGAGTYTYHLGMEVESAGDLPEGMSERVIPASMAALFIHQYYGNESSDLAMIPDTHDYIYNNWLPNSDYMHCGQNILIERWRRGQTGLDMLIPVVPRVSRHAQEVSHA